MIKGSRPYVQGYVQNIAHGVKQHEREAIVKMAVSLAPFVKPEDIIIPAPNHEGRAIYTLDTAEIIRELTGADILDCLYTVPRIPLYELKKQNSSAVLEMYLSCPVPKNRRIFFLDNVISTGKTFFTAKALIPDIKPLIFAAAGEYKEGKIIL